MAMARARDRDRARDRARARVWTGCCSGLHESFLIVQMSWD